MNFWQLSECSQIMWCQ